MKVAELTQQSPAGAFRTTADRYDKLAKAPALDSGEFDKEIQEIATAMAERRKKK